MHRTKSSHLQFSSRRLICGWSIWKCILFLVSSKKLIFFNSDRTWKHIFFLLKFKMAVKIHTYIKSFRIRSFSNPHFPAFALNIEIYGVNLRIQFEHGKMQTRKTLSTYTIYAVLIYLFTYLFISFSLTLTFFILQWNICTKKPVCQNYSTLIYVNKYTMRKIN